jgi:Antitoxin-like ribbon-helix-helix
MSKKQSLSAALQTFERNPETQAAPAAPAARSKPRGTQSTHAPSRVGKKALIGYFDPGVSKQLKQMALNNDSSVQELLREALNDFFQKHKKPGIA